MKPKRINKVRGVTHHLAKDLTGQKFGRLTAIERIPYPNGARYVCECECGNKSLVATGSLLKGITKSCGCYIKEVFAKAGITHGLSKHYLHKTWCGMRDRCSCKTDYHYESYGGRGIKVCDRWQDFTLFLEDMGERPSPQHTIDRIDNNGDYEPSNCRWATKEEQSSNRRNSQIFEYNGQKATIAQWSRIYDMPDGVLRARLMKKKWSIDKTLNTPVAYKKKLTEELVEQIIVKLKNGMNAKDVVRHFHIDFGTVKKIRDENNIPVSGRYITYNGETKTLIEWSKQTGLKRETISKRIENGWSIEDALTMPILVNQFSERPLQTIPTNQ